MAEYFFTEYTKLVSQLDTEAFGPVKTFEKDKYRVTSKIKSSSPANAYAVTGGKVLVQLQSNGNYVNLLLFPNSMSQTAFTPVLFYIYRGLRKQNFLDSTGKIVALSTTDSTDLTNKIWESFNKQKSKDLSIPTSEPNVQSIGWNYNLSPDTTLILDILNNPNPNFERFDVNAGDFIGIFEGTTTHPIGFEICLKEKFFDYSLKELRLDELIIEPTYIIQGSDIEGRLTIQQMRERENILNFVDPAAYFNIHYNLVIKGKTGASETSFTKLQIAQNLTNNFFTSQTVYIDIRNENGYSINYYKDYEGTLSNSNYGKHIQFGTASSSLIPSNYYVNYWPIYTTSFSSPATLPTIWLSISDEFGSQPFIYFDCAFQNRFGDLEEIFNAKFKLLLDSVNNWTDNFNINVPTFASTTIAWLNKIYVGRTKYAVTLPSTSPKRQHYLDYLFGSINDVSLNPPVSSTKWSTTFGKKLVHAIPLGFIGAVEVVVSETNTQISFLLNIVDVFALNSSFPSINPQTQISLDSISGMGKVSNPEFIFDADKTKVDIRIKPILIENKQVVTYIYDDDSPDKKTLCHLIISRNEFDNYIKPAINNVNTSIHDATLSLIGVSGAASSVQAILEPIIDSSGITYYKGLLRIKGLAPNGIPSIDNPLQAIDILTLDGAFFQSLSIIPSSGIKDATDQNAYFSIDEAISFIKIVEETFMRDDLESLDIKDNNLEDVSTRIRVHSYGRATKLKSPLYDPKALGTEILIQKAFENLVKDAPHSEFRYLSEYTLKKIKGEDGVNAFKHLSSVADENGFQDNTGPYLKVKKPTPNSNQYYEADFGQILYGFHSFLWPNMGKGYEGFNEYDLYKNNSYSNFLFYPITISPIDPIKLISYDFSGLIANIATPIPEYFFHLKHSYSPQDAGLNIPLIADLDFYYQISAPTADLFGNAEALGIYKAYTNLKHNFELKLSDVFTLYYKGLPFLRSGINVNTIEFYYNSMDRWKILGIELDFLVKTGSSFTWRPDTPSDLIWIDIRKKLLNKIFLFTEFWYNKCTHKEKTGLRVSRNYKNDIYRFYADTTLIDDTNMLFDLFDYDPTTDKSTLKNAAEYCLDQKFIIFLKLKIQEESPGII